jgi:hypothetical protein
MVAVLPSLFLVALLCPEILEERLEHRRGDVLSSWLIIEEELQVTHHVPQ